MICRLKRYFTYAKGDDVEVTAMNDADLTRVAFDDGRPDG